MSTYYLPRNVYFCRRGDNFVFLDLHSDKYTLLDDDAAAALRELLSAASASESRAQREAIDALLANQLLTRDASTGRPIVPTKADVAVESLVSYETPASRTISLQHLIRFFLACTKALLRLRWRHLEETIEVVRLRKVRGRESSAHRNLHDVEQLTSIFMRLRPFFPRDFLCLFDSLALIEFLAMYDIFPTWFFGVCLEPWGAHCWLQEGSYVLDDDVEGAAGYTPVMVI